MLDRFLVHSTEEHSSISDSVAAFQRAWRAVDPQGTMMIPAARLPGLLVGLPPPLGLASPADGAAPPLRPLLERLTLVRLLPSGGMIQYHELLVALAEVQFGVELPSWAVRQLELEWARCVCVCVCSAPVTVHFRCSPLLCLLHTPKVNYQCYHTPRGGGGGGNERSAGGLR